MTQLQDVQGFYNPFETKKMKNHKYRVSFHVDIIEEPSADMTEEQYHNFRNRMMKLALNAQGKVSFEIQSLGKVKT